MSNFTGTDFWEYIYNQFTSEVYIDTDPILFPKTYSGNIEFIGLVASLFAYGRVSSIQAFLKDFFHHYGTDPFFIKTFNSRLYYRFQNAYDIQVLLEFLVDIYKKYGSFENFFRYISLNLEDALSGFLNMASEFGCCKGAGKGYFFLFPSYGKSGLKRLRMFLRWMVRKDSIDFGLWKNYSSAMLTYPIDTHILRFGLNFGVLTNDSNSHRNALKITRYFKSINPDDPVKYDFAITRLGMLNRCIFTNSRACENCSISGKCIFN